MKEKKNIDRLFQEKFKDFEVHPGEHVWEGISAKKEQKRDRVIPLWFQLAGVAAIFALLFFGGLSLLQDNTPKETPSLVEEQVIDHFENNVEDRNPSNIYTNTPDNNPDEAVGEPAITESNPVSTDRAQNNSPAAIYKPSSKNNTNTNAVVISSNTATQDTNKTAISGIAQGENKQASSLPNGIKSNDNITSPSEDLNNQKNAASKIVAASESETSSEVSEKETDKKSILEAIDETQEAENTLVDTPKNTKRWGVSPIVAPVYYNSFGGSGIAPEFNDNAKDGEVNLSYGVQLSYAISDRLTVRSGINKVDLSYSTDNIGFSPDVQARSISSIDYYESGEIITIQDAGRTSFVNSAQQMETPLSQPKVSTGSLSQRLGYIEVPMELEYAVIDQKLGLQLIGGVSTLFLNDNEISLTDGELTTALGESNSLNRTSFTTNVGVGLDYELSDYIQVNLEPMFKYQLNAYKNSVSDFKPYYMGLYTGVSIKF